MIDNAEKNGVLDFLHFLNPDAVFALAAVITRNLIKIGTIEEAKDGILFYAASGSDILCRQKIHKQLIFDYLYTRGIFVDPNSNKGAIVARTIDFWKDGKRTNEVVESSNTETTLNDNTTVEKMGEVFSNWFYQLLNSVHPVYKQLVPAKSSEDLFGASHFSPDCQLILTEFGLDGSVMSQLSQPNANDSCQYLSSLVLTRELFFQPNVESGVKAKQDVHGLVQIVVAGTVYHQNACVGVFEQMFGLVRDVLRSDLWKIKFTKLNVRHNSSPSVTGVEESIADRSICN